MPENETNGAHRSHLYDKGFESAKRWKLEEDNGNLKLAKQFASDAISSFLEALKLEPDKERQKTVRANVEVMLNDAESLNKRIQVCARGW